MAVQIALRPAVTRRDPFLEFQNFEARSPRRFLRLLGRGIRSCRLVAPRFHNDGPFGFSEWRWFGLFGR
jgi:hypothetical protein